MPIEDAFEMFIEVFKGEGTEFVENAASPHNSICAQWRPWRYWAQIFMTMAQLNKYNSIINQSNLLSAQVVTHRRFESRWDRYFYSSCYQNNASAV